MESLRDAVESVNAETAMLGGVRLHNGSLDS